MPSGNENRRSDTEVDQYRRKLLAALGAAGTAGLAGCGGGDGTPTDGGSSDGNTGDGSSDGDGGGGDTDSGDGGSDSTPSGDVEHFPDRRYVTFEGELESDRLRFNKYYHRSQMPRFVYPFMYAKKTMMHQETAERIPHIVTDWEIVDDTEIKVQFRDDSSWAVANPDDPNDINGTPVKPSDWGYSLRIARWNGLSPAEIKEQNPNGEPLSAFNAITSIEFDDDAGTLTVHSEPGWFDIFSETAQIDALNLSHPNNQSIGESLATMAQDMKPLHDQVKELEWAQPEGTANTSDPTYRTELIQRETDRLRERGEEEIQKPQNIPCSGPFVLQEVREDQVILKKNSEYFLSDRINWDTVQVNIIPNTQSQTQALQNSILDGVNGRVLKPNPSTVDNLPDEFRRVNHTGGGQYGLSMNAQANEYLADPRVRQAFNFAINKKQIAEIRNRYANEKVPYPAGLLDPVQRGYVEDAGLTDSFTRYNRNMDRGTTLMKEAGFTKENGSWVTPEGEPFELTLLTGGSSVQVESTVIAFLNEFGVNVSLQKVDSTVADQRKGDGDFELTMYQWPFASHQGAWFRMVQQSDRRHRFGSLWSDEFVEKFANKYDNVDNVEYDWTMNLEGARPEQQKEFTLEAPPVGEPDGEMQEYPVWFYDTQLGQNLDEETRAEYQRKLCWVFNYRLPIAPFVQSFEMAFQDTANWTAPEDESEWQMNLPIFQLIQQGKIQATSGN
ncbi:ABC transporter substrate-binding protein [Halosimplex sp. J119]